MLTRFIGKVRKDGNGKGSEGSGKGAEERRRNQCLLHIEILTSTTPSHNPERSEEVA